MSPKFNFISKTACPWLHKRFLTGTVRVVFSEVLACLLQDETDFRIAGWMCFGALPQSFSIQFLTEKLSWTAWCKTARGLETRR